MSAVRVSSAVAIVLLAVWPAAAEPLPDTQPLTAEGDLAAQMVEGMHKYLDRETASSIKKRQQSWKLDFTSAETYQKSVEPNRERLQRILGVVDKRLPVTELEYIATPGQSAMVAEAQWFRAYAVRWPVLEGVDAEGLLLEPRREKVFASVVALPDADWTPEMLAGLAPGVPKECQFARQLAESGCRVLLPTLIDRNDTWSGNPRIRMSNQTHREFVYRMAYHMGRHVIGYEIQKVLAAVDYFTREEGHPPVGVFGFGEGGLLALHCAALDKRIKTTVVSGYFNRREKLWQEPIYRNVWGLLREFGDAELIYLTLPRSVIVEHSGFGPIESRAPR